VLGDAAAARAAVELCPATASVAVPIGAAFGAAATQYTYDLEAPTPRTVDAELIADTDKGWFKWNVTGVELMDDVRFVAEHPSAPDLQRQLFHVGVSSSLAVTFPTALLVRHAWIVSANAGKGVSPCDVPPFGSASDKTPPPTNSVTPTPAPSSVAAVATATDPPFAITTCAVPFADSTVAKPVQPAFALPSGSMMPDAAAATIEVALDPSGKLIDAWVYASTGIAVFNHAALVAARASTYVGAVSYCRSVSSTYLFQSLFLKGR
jgi:hypothetical protein